MMTSENLPVTGAFFFTPLSGAVGSTVRIFPQDDGLQVTGVQFNGVPAQFSFNLEMGGLNAIVPQGATTGKIKLIFPGGSALSGLTFTVTTPSMNVPSISSFTPTSGTAGTVVQVLGQNLANVTEARLNGVNALIRFASATRVDIEVPQGATTGRITLTSGDGTATSPSDFTVPVQTGGPTITNFTPGSGSPGATVSIFGTGFTNVLQVFFNGTPTGFSPVNSGQINAMVPSGATTGRISVQTSAGTAISLQDFQIQTSVGLPVISSFSPTSGKAGDTVTINGVNLGQVSAASFNFTPATFNIASNVTLFLTVPAGASTGKIRLTNPAGQALSAQDFVITTPAQKPVINSITPSSGKAGDQIMIAGQFFGGTTQVIIGGQVAQFNAQNDTLLTAIVPVGAVTGPVSVTNAAGTTTSTQIFTVNTVVQGPAILGFTPTSGQVGTTVTVTGQNFSGLTSLKLGNITVTPTSVSPGQIVFNVPSGAVTGPVQVTTPAGTATSTASFTVTTATQNPPAISGFSPASGPVGTSVTVTGQNFNGLISLKLGNITVTPTSVSPDQIVFNVPSGAVTGLVQVTTPSGTATSTASFTVSVATQNPPVILGFSPQSGPAGTTVMMTGQNFSGLISLKLGNITVTPTTALAGKIVFNVPQGASSGRIQVTTSGGTATSNTDFVVPVAPPTTQPLSMFADPVQPTDITPLIDNETGAEFNSGDSIGLLRIISGQRKTINLFAKRPDFMPDKVEIFLRSPMPSNLPLGLQIKVPTQPVDANVRFQIEVITEPTLMETELFILQIGGRSLTFPGSEYIPFTLNMAVFAPVVFRIEDVIINPGEVVDKELAILRRRYNFEVPFNVSVPDGVGLTVTKSMRLNTQPNTNRGGLKDTYQITFAAELGLSAGTYDVTYTTPLTGIRVKLPDQKITVNGVPLLILDEPTEKMVSAGEDVIYGFSIVPNGVEDSVVVRVVKGQMPTTDDILLPSRQTIDLAMTTNGSVKLFVSPGVMPGLYNFNVLLESDGGTVFDQKPIAVEVTTEKVTIFPNANPVSLFEKESLTTNVNFLRLSGFTGGFLFDAIPAISPPNDVSIEVLPSREVQPGQINRRVRRTARVLTANKTNDIVLRVLDANNTGQLIGQEKKLTLLLRTRLGFVQFTQTQVIIKPNTSGTIEIRFNPDVSNAFTQPLGQFDVFSVALSVKDQSGRDITDFRLEEGGRSSNTGLEVEINNNKRSAQITVSANPGFVTFATYRLVGTWKLTGDNERLVTFPISPACEINYQIV